MTQAQKTAQFARKKANTPRSISWDTGRAAFKLISQHRTSADPTSYAVWFAYVAKSNPELVSAIDAILAQSRGITAAEMRQLHDLYVAKTQESEAKLENISQAIESKVAGAKSLVTEAISNSTDYVSQMGQAKERLPNSSSPEQIIEALDEIIENTLASQESAQSIQFALESTQTEITQLNSQVGQLRESLMRDSLTSLVNRQKFEAQLAESSTEALANGYSLTVMAVCIKNLRDLCLTADTDISEFVVQSLARILTKCVGEKGVCASITATELAIMLPRSAYADASKVARVIVDELEQFKIVKKPSNQKVGYIECAFGGAALQAGRSPSDLIRIASEQAHQAKHSHKSHVKFDLSTHQAA